MHTSNVTGGDVSATLSIGTVAKLTGISVHTLRAWEKRHHVVSVVRSSTGRRLYSTDDVQRLRLLKQLTESGHSIGNVAPLDNAALEAMLDLANDEGSASRRDGRNAATTLAVSVYIDGESHSAWDESVTHHVVKVASVTHDMGDVRRVVDTDKVSAHIFYLGTITIHQLRFLRQLGEGVAQRCFVVFSFAQRELIDELQGLGFHLVRAPITTKSLFDNVAKTLVMDGDAPFPSSDDAIAAEVPPHKFSRKQLRQLARISTAIDCECPQHLSTIVRSLTLFESYSQKCASKNEQNALLHNDIYKLTAQARSHMERAISMVIEAENIHLVDHD